MKTDEGLCGDGYLSRKCHDFLKINWIRVCHNRAFRSVSEYWGGSRYGRRGVRTEASGTQSLSFNFKCPQQR